MHNARSAVSRPDRREEILPQRHREHREEFFKEERGEEFLREENRTTEVELPRKCGE
jgi:hypothetical protein